MLTRLPLVSTRVDGGSTVGTRYQTIVVGGSPAEYISRGSGPPLVLLHGVGDNAADWQWVLAQLAATHCVYAPNLPGFDGSYQPAVEYSSAFYARFVGNFLDALGIERAAIVGNSFGFVAALRYALAEPERVSALGLADSAGMGRTIHPALPPLTLPGFGEMGIEWGATAVGAMQRAWTRASLVFSRLAAVPPAWIDEQYRLARTPGALRTALSVLRAGLDPLGQRDLIIDHLPRLNIPTCVIWGEHDGVVPIRHGQAAARLLRQGTFIPIAQCGHLPHVEQPDQFATALGRFLCASGSAHYA